MDITSRMKPSMPSALAAAPAAAIASGDAMLFSPNALPATVPTMASSAIQIAIWVRPTRPTPIILPNISWNGRQLLTTTSTMRLVFSSMTLFIIIAPYMSTNM